MIIQWLEGEPQKQRKEMESIISEVLGRLFPASLGENRVMCFVDLGLPSGVLWAPYDVEEPTMVGCTLPTYEQAAELINYCDFYIEEGADGTSYMVARGPSGQSISFPMREYDVAPVASGCCWCQGEPSPGYGYFMLLSEMTITVGVAERDMQFPYRMVQK